MSYRAGTALQAAIFAALAEDAGLAALVGGRIFDAVPPGPVSGTWVSLGPEEVRDASDGSGGGAVYEVVLSAITDEAGFQAVKAVAEAISDRLLGGAPLVLARGRLVGLWFLKARARRVDTGAQRRIDLTFRARIDIEAA